MVFIYSTCKDKEQAETLAKALVQGKLAACVDMWPTEAIYWWEGQLVRSKEVMLLVKTLEQKTADVEEFIKNNHTYKIPIVASFDVRRLNRDYKEWIPTVL